jgi:hypothetical protein
LVAFLRRAALQNLVRPLHLAVEVEAVLRQQEVTTRTLLLVRGAVAAVQVAKTTVRELAPQVLELSVADLSLLTASTTAEVEVVLVTRQEQLDSWPKPEMVRLELQRL